MNLKFSLCVILIMMGWDSVSFAASRHSLSEGVEAFTAGNFSLVKEVISELDRGVPQSLQAQIYSFAIENNFTVKPTDVAIKEIISRNEDPIYRVLEGRLHLLGIHPKAQPKNGLKMIEELSEGESYAAYTLGLFYEGKFGHVKSLRKASEWYKTLVDRGYQAALTQFAEVQQLIARSEAVDRPTRLLTAGENEWDSEDEWEDEERTDAKPMPAASAASEMDLGDTPIKVSFEDLQTVDLYKDAVAIKVSSTVSRSKKKKALENLRNLEKLRVLDLGLCELKTIHVRALPALVHLKKTVFKL